MHRRQFLMATAMAAIGGCAGKRTRSEADGHETEAEPSQTATPNGPVRLSLGGSHERSDGVRVSINALRMTRQIRDIEDGFLRARPERAFVMIFLEATNVGAETAALPHKSEFTLVSNEEQYKPGFDGEGVSPRFANLKASQFDFPIDGRLYDRTVNAYPGVSKSGWIVYEVPAETSSLQMILDPRNPDFRLVTWDGVVDPSMLPQAEVTAIDGPMQVTNGEDLTMSFTIRNTGETTALFEQPFLVERSSRDDTSQDVECSTGRRALRATEPERDGEISD